MMKKFCLLLMVLVLLCGAAASAQVVDVQEHALTFDVQMTIPEDAEATQEDFGEFTCIMIHLDGKNGVRPLYRMTIAASEEIDEGRSMADLTQDEKDTLVDVWMEGMQNATHKFDVLENGNTVLVIEENTETDDYAMMISIHDGYFFHLYMNYENYSKLTDADLDMMYELMESVQIVEAQQ